jgi:hypothetical protein
MNDSLDIFGDPIQPESSTDDEITKRERLDIFRTIIPSILERKNHTMHVLESEKDYAPFLVNKMISYHDDGIFRANEMNMNYHLPNRLQYDYYFHSIQAKRRPFTPWMKQPKIKELEAVKQFFGYSDAKSQVAINTLSAEQIKEIVSVLTT